MYTCLYNVQCVSGDKTFVYGLHNFVVFYSCIGHAIYPGLALLNHSCYSNINKYFLGTTMVAVASRVGILLTTSGGELM